MRIALEELLVQVDLHQRVDLAHRVACTLRLGPADVALPVDDLTLQVRLVDDVEVDDAESAHAGRGEVHQRGRAEAAGTYAQHSGVLQPLLPIHRDVGDDQVPRVAPDLVRSQRLSRLDERRQ
jgi:hypothetical protein